jgi:hypothetical protein|tara:strand:- start:887 stop:1357 length:471 start_codon:yes stop_codon:yes gene_type:complete
VSTDRYRYTLNAEAKRIDMHTPEDVTIPIYDLAEDSGKLLALAFLGVKQYLNQNVTRAKGRSEGISRTELIQTLAVELQNKTPDDMHRRGRPKASEGPRILKRDRIAALASIKGCTVTALTEALNRVASDKVDAVLNSSEVNAFIASRSDMGAEIS